MAKPRPACTISIKFDSGKFYRIDLSSKSIYHAKHGFDIKFTDNTGEARRGSGTITRISDRLRRLLVKEL